jgi:Tfp pilus assembly protein PilV
MKKNKKAFSLVELIIATIVLTIGVFWVSALLTNTQNNINNVENFSKKETLFYSVFECFKSEKDFSNSTDWATFYVNFWTDLKECDVNSTKTATTINNLDYYFKVEVTDKTSNEKELKIFVNNKKRIFRIFK